MAKIQLDSTNITYYSLIPKFNFLPISHVNQATFPHSKFFIPYFSKTIHNNYRTPQNLTTYYNFHQYEAIEANHNHYSKPADLRASLKSSSLSQCLTCNHHGSIKSQDHHKLPSALRHPCTNVLIKKITLMC